MSSRDEVDALVAGSDGANAQDEMGGRRPTLDAEAPVEYTAKHVTSILKPVIITMSLVIWLVRNLGRNTAEEQSYSALMVYREQESDATGTRLFGSLLNALIFVGAIMGFTFVFVLLYKYRCVKIIYGWLTLSVLMLLGGSGFYMFYSLAIHFAIPIDQFTFFFVLYNFAVVGALSVFWHAPSMVRQGYLVAVSVIMAWVLTKLPEWTNWALLCALALYDLFAVLSPCGPLKALVEMSQERNEPIPGLVYEADAPAQRRTNPSAGAVLVTMTLLAGEGPDNGRESRVSMSSVKSDPSQSGRYANESDHLPMGATEDEGEMYDIEDDYEDDDEARGIKLGIGDFVFYSVLIGRAAANDITTVISCFIAVIGGLVGTLFLLAVAQKALPALPISIFMGMVAYFIAVFGTTPMMAVISQVGAAA